MTADQLTDIDALRSEIDRLDAEILAEVYIELIGGKQASLGLGAGGHRCGPEYCAGLGPDAGDCLAVV